MTIPIKEPPEVTELDDTKIDQMERQIGDLENAMGPTLPKALVELGRKRPRFFRVTAKRTALIYLAIWIKANNPKNNSYQTQKYKNKLREFLSLCKLPEEYMIKYKTREQLSKSDMWPEWEEEMFQGLGDTVEDLLQESDQLNTFASEYFLKFIR